MSENIILIPVYNDWKSLNKLLLEINSKSNRNVLIKILIINDCSTQKIEIKRSKLNKIKEVKVLTLNQNLGSQRAIAIGLDYLKKLNTKSFITIMDGDGEDDPNEINKMLLLAQKNVNYIITSNRTERNENLFIRACYKFHLFFCFLLTWKWISFGNFSCFHSNNLKKINLNDVWCAFSSAVLKNSNIKKLYAARAKRYFENSKVNFLKLIEHALRVNSIFYKKVLINSFFYIFLIWLFSIEFSIFLYLLILSINLMIIFIKFKYYVNTPIEYNIFKKNIKIIR